eukprot:scaffold242716_cov29-Prasinocladus_malaysianus.AAC.1
MTNAKCSSLLSGVYFARIKWAMRHGLVYIWTNIRAIVPRITAKNQEFNILILCKLYMLVTFDKLCISPVINTIGQHISEAAVFISLQTAKKTYGLPGAGNPGGQGRLGLIPPARHPYQQAGSSPLCSSAGSTMMTHAEETKFLCLSTKSVYA